MYICLNCEEIFEEAESYTETHGLSSPPYEEMEGCPYCYGEFAETFLCDSCGNYIVEKYIEIGSDKICDNCYEEKCISEGF